MTDQLNRARTNRRVALWISAALFALSTSVQTAGATIIPVSDSRYVEYTVYMGNPPNTTTRLEPSPPFASFDANLGGGRAVQQSSLAADQILGSGSAYGSGPYVGTGFAGVSVLELTFQVDSAADYDLFGVLGTIGESRGSFLRWTEGGVEQFTILGPDCGSFCNVEMLESFSTTLSLTPGVTYGLRTVASQGGLDGGGSYDITLQIVPEPATGLLVAMGVSVLAAFRPRR